MIILLYFLISFFFLVPQTIPLSNEELEALINNFSKDESSKKIAILKM